MLGLTEIRKPVLPEVDSNRLAKYRLDRFFATLALQSNQLNPMDSGGWFCGSIRRCTIPCKWSASSTMGAANPYLLPGSLQKACPIRLSGDREGQGDGQFGVERQRAEPRSGNIPRVWILQPHADDQRTPRDFTACSSTTYTPASRCVST
ncbi:hypothetical protein AX14_012993 [Amanita brunnescens Koide BX004]|nr:hypothetical protein AX14_012993 [Amanita brunnescens Koide BX004]